MREIALDIERGADIIMVKPAGPDIIACGRSGSMFHSRLHVSGEYAMIEAAAIGWLDRERTIVESVTAIKRAGADILLTYYALELAKLL
jgi:porphobilinogen synthase